MEHNNQNASATAIGDGIVDYFPTFLYFSIGTGFSLKINFQSLKMSYCVLFGLVLKL